MIYLLFINKIKFIIITFNFKNYIKKLHRLELRLN